MQQNARKIPKARITLTAVVLIAYVIFNAIFNHFSYMIQAESGLSQFSNDAVEIGIGQLFSQHNIPGLISTVVFLVACAIIWAPCIWKRNQTKQD